MRLNPNRRNRVKRLDVEPLIGQTFFLALLEITGFYSIPRRSEADFRSMTRRSDCAVCKQREGCLSSEAALEQVEPEGDPMGG